jgi:hypothetical protein
MGERGCVVRSGDRLASLAEAMPLDSDSPAATLGATKVNKQPTGEFQGIPRLAPLARNDKSSGDRMIGRSGAQMQIPRRYAPRNDKSDVCGNDTSDVCGVVRRMYELKARHESGSLFRDPLRIEVVVEMAARAAAEVFTIKKDDELVAAALTFIDGDVCRFYGTYYDDRWAVYSPGVSLLYRVIQRAQARGLDFDLMTGEQPYKMRFASEVVPLYMAHLPAAVSLAA